MILNVFSGFGKSCFGDLHIKFDLQKDNLFETLYFTYFHIIGVSFKVIECIINISLKKDKPRISFS